MIYLVLRGRIGNQLFMYAMARNIQYQLGETTKIIIDYSEVVSQHWTNSLEFYSLHNVEYIHKRDIRYIKIFFTQLFFFKFYTLYCKYIAKKSYQKRYSFERTFRKFFERSGLLVCETGYLPFVPPHNKNILLVGYFQSERYFESITQIIRKEFTLNNYFDLSNYPGIQDIKYRNSVCISIKIEHTVGNKATEVCKKDYWKDAIVYMMEHVENPLFFICSDNIEYVKENILDDDKYDAIYQAPEYPVHISLAVMNLCKHFIIGNTSFGWWAQYLSNNEDKIVIAPSKWTYNDAPVAIYQKNWHLIDV